MNFHSSVLTFCIRKSDLRLTKAIAQLLAMAFALCSLISCSSTTTSVSGDTADLNARLKGNYTYIMSGSFFSNGTGFYRRAGTLVADGEGHITGGSDDFIQGFQPVTSQITGSYTVASDGTGLMLLRVGSTQLQWVFTIVSNSALDLIEFDGLATGAGGARLQTSAALTTAPSGTFVFSLHSFLANHAAQASVSKVGRMTVGSDGSVNGEEDVVRAGVFSSPTFTGSLGAPDSTGKGSLNLVDSQGLASAYFYYVIDSNTLNLLETDLDPTGAPNFGGGRAETQSGTAFSNASLNNGFVFTSAGDTAISLFGMVSVGAFTSTGDGNIVSGSYDSVQDGVPISNADLAGTYNVASNGRMTITLNSQVSGLATLREVAWMINPSKAFYLVNIPSRVENGTLYQQQNTSFSNASVNGQFSFTMFGGDNQGPSDIERVGMAAFDGKSALTLVNYFVNRGGSKSQTSAPSGTYTVTSNGRVSAAVSGISNNIVIYMISNNSGYLILEDPNTEVAGAIAQEVSP